MFYASVAMLALIACCYLLFRQGNAFAKDITPPTRLRRWTAAFFGSVALCHLWYLPMYFLTSPDDMKLGSLIAGLLDSMTIIPLTIVILLTMLQDRRRPLWPVAAMVTPLIAGLAWCIVNRSEALIPAVFVYFLLMWLGLIIYMVRALRQYGRWLRENYADLEHKEVWQGFVVLAIILLVYAIYSLDAGELIYEYALDVIIIVLVCYLLWRVETLNNLEIYNLRIYDLQDLRADDLTIDNLQEAIAADDAEEETVTTNDAAEETVSTENVEDTALSQTIRDKIGPLLKQYCEEPQLYLQYDISLSQLATLIGVNRSYLSKHFALQGITYNAYINGLRIQHFISLYHEAVAAHKPVIAQKQALQSGFRSYNTFSVAFKKVMGTTVTEWMRTPIPT